MHGRVVCSDAIAAPEASFPFHGDLANLTKVLRAQKLQFTGNINNGGFVQRYVYHELVATLASARHAAGHRHTHVCETGFNAGHSALLYLLSHPTVRYFGFEAEAAPTNFKRKRWASRAALGILAARFPARINVTFGNSHETIVPFFGAKPGLRCDVLSIDGDHTYAGVLADLSQLEPHLRDGGVILADDCEEGNYVSPWGAAGRNFTQGAMYDAFADFDDY